MTSSGDYSGETASSVSVTERDNDSASTTVTLRVSPDEVSENSSSQVVTVTGTLNGGTRGDATTVSVSVSGGTASSTDFAPVGAITLTIAANQTSGEATFTLSPVNDAIDENDETVSVSGTTTAIGLTVPGTEVTITDDDTRGVTVTPTILAVDEGGSEEYTVVLTSQPTASVTVSVTKSGDSDITVNKTSLIFTASNWDAAQIVTVNAREDDDVVHDLATITHSVTSSGDYSGETASTVSVTERDNYPAVSRTERASTTVTLSVSPDEVSENSSGQVVTVTGTLNESTRTDATTVSVTVGSGTATSGTDFATVGAITLTIAANQASGEATFTLSPVNDAIDEDNETVSVSGTTKATGLGITSTQVTITDDDDRGVTVTPTTLKIDEGGSETYTVVLTSQPTESVTVSVTKTGDSDIAANKTSLTFTASNWNTAQTVMVSAAEDDDAAHGTATIAHGVTSSGDYSGETASSVSVTERDKDSASTTVTLRVSPDEVSESSSSQVVTVTGTLNGGTRADATTVSVSVGSGTATSGTDFAPVGAITLTIAANQTSGEATFTLSPVNDAVDETDETVEVSGIATTGLTVIGTTVTIIDNDTETPLVPMPQVTIFPASQTESAGKMVFEVRLSKASEKPITAICTALDGTAEADKDYKEEMDVIRINPGATTGKIEVKLIDDSEEEGDETFTMVMSELVNAEFEGGGQTATARGTILDDDEPEPEVFVSFDQWHYTVSEGGNAVQIRVHLSSTFDHRVELSLSAVHGNGATKADYSGVPEKIVFETWDDVKTFEVMAIDDDEDDDGETVVLNFDTLPDGIYTGGQSTIEIIDNDDPIVTVSYGKEKYEIPEGGSARLLSVRLSEAPERRVEIPLLAVPGNGATEADYSPVPERVIFLPYQVEKMFQVMAIDDDDDDDGETVMLSFGTLPDRVNQGSLSTISIIDNDDPEIKVSFGERNYEITEGGPAVQVSVHLSADPERRVVIPLWMSSSPDGATEADYSGVPERLIFESGEQVKTFAVLATDDDEIEDVESVRMRFRSLPDGVTWSSLSTLSIIDNDNPDVTVSYGQESYKIVEGGSAVQVTVHLSADPRRLVVIPLLASPGDGATKADYSGVPEQVVFESGETIKTFELLATDDNVDDDSETLRLSFGSLPDRVNNGGSALVSLVDNDDPVVMVSFDQAHYTVTEGGSAVTVTISLSADPERRVAIPLLVTLNNGATETDYSGVPEQIVFESGETSKTFDLLATDDDMDDDGETLTLSFGRLPNRVNNGGSALVSLVDNDDPVVMVSFDQAHYTVTEGGSAVTVTISLSADPERRVAIPLLVTLGNGATEADYSGVPERVIFESSEMVKSFELLATDDDMDEDDETVALGFGVLPQRVRLESQATVKIIDNDERNVTVSVVELAVPEGGANTYTVVLHSMPTSPVTLQVSGMENTDVLVEAPQLTFTAGNWYVPQEVEVRTRDDDDAVVDRVVTLNHAISGGDYGTVVVAPVSVTIIEDDVPMLSIEDQSASEDTAEMVFTAMLNVQSSEEVRVSYKTLNGTAEAGTDYKATQGTLRFAALETHQTFLVPIINDDLDEGDETFMVILSEPVNAALRTDNAQALGTIVDEDAVPRAMELLLSSVGRLVATETVEIISRRFESQRLDIRPSLMLGGRILSLDDRMGGHALVGLARNLAGVIGVDLWMPSYYGSGGGMGVSQEPMRPLSMSTRQPSWIAHAGNSMGSPVRFRRVTLWDVLSRSAFELPLNHKEQGGQWTLWGQGAASRISGQPSAVRTIDLESLSGYLGIDYRFHKDALVGLTLTHILGDMDYGGRDDDSLVPFDFNLTSLMPYFYYQVRPKLGLWGILGIGRGRASITETEESLETPMMLFMGASGMRQDLATYRSIDLAVKADAFFVSTGSEAQLNLSKLRENVERVRLLLEGRNTRQMGTASQLTQSLEVGTRWDVGRIARGAGIDLGGGLEYAHTELGLGVAARGRYLLIHGRSGYEEWGASLMLRTDPGWGKRGLVLTMAPVWGVPSQGAEAMWRDTQSLISNPVRTSQQGPGIRPDRMEVDFGYRFVRHATGALIMPYSGFSFGGRGWQSYRLGGRVAVDERMDFNLEVEHGSQAQSSIRLRMYMYW